MHTSRIPFRTRSDEPYGLLTIHRDITELKQAEELAQHRAEQVTIAAEIARDTTGTLEVKPLLQKAVNLVRDRFGFYHSSIFLVDSSNEYAVLRESTGEAGRQMLLSGHRLAVGSRSIVGQVTATGKALVVNNVRLDPTHFPNPLLPDTKSELAIPLIVGERVLGALDVQSTQIDAFNAEEDLNVLQILADQLAVAVVNGELFAKAQELLGKHRLLRQISTAASSSGSLEDALFNIVSGLRTALVSDRIAILLVNREGMLQVNASAGYEGTHHREVRIAVGEGITGLAAAERRAIRVDDTLTDPRYINVDTKPAQNWSFPSCTTRICWACSIWRACVLPHLTKMTKKSWARLAATWAALSPTSGWYLRSGSRWRENASCLMSPAKYGAQSIWRQSCKHPQKRLPVR
jgi:GAF domain-containing protein